MMLVMNTPTGILTTLAVADFDFDDRFGVRPGLTL